MFVALETKWFYGDDGQLKDIQNVVEGLFATKEEAVASLSRAAEAEPVMDVRDSEDGLPFFDLDFGPDRKGRVQEVVLM